LREISCTSVYLTSHVAKHAKKHSKLRNLILVAPPKSDNPLVALYFSCDLQELYSMGGRNILLMGLPPLGCVPAQITLHGHGNSTCVQSLNDVASKMNQQIISLLEGMKKDTPGARLIYIDIFAPIYNAFQDPQKYGMNAYLVLHILQVLFMHVSTSRRFR
jgi:phospholipase/lecithinase/hemolysin